MEENNPKIINYLVIIGIFAFILTSTIGLALFIPQLNNEISIYEQDILETKDELDNIYRIEVMKGITYSDLNDITSLYPIIIQNFDISNANQTLFAFEMLQNETLHHYKKLVYLGTIYQGNGTSFEYLDEFDLEQLRQMNNKLNEMNGQEKNELEYSLTEKINTKIEIEDRRDFWLNIILILQIISFFMTNSGEIYSHFKIIWKK